MAWARKKKKYNKPRNMYSSARIEEESKLIEKYGLKNRKEIWKADAAIRRIREQAKDMITASQEEQKELFDKLRKIGFSVEKIADILALDKEDWLKRRLQTIVYEKKLAETPKQARQFITHKHVKVGNKVVNVPSYIVKEEEVDKIEVAKKNKKKVKGGEETNKSKESEK